MATPQLDTQMMYTIIADAMPTEGRDFTIDIVQGDGKQPTIVLKPLTAVGRGFVPALLEQLSEKMKDKNVSFSSDGVAEREVDTINTIRAAIEKDAMAALHARLEDARRQHKAKMDEIAKEDKERGKRVFTAEEAKKRSSDVNEAQRFSAQQRQIQYMIDHVQEAREKVDAESKRVAETESKDGKDWSVDMDAPLTTLFDRQDVTDKLKRKETITQQMTAYMYMVEDLMRSAANTGKQYILQK